MTTEKGDWVDPADIGPRLLLIAPATLPDLGLLAAVLQAALPVGLVVRADAPPPAGLAGLCHQAKCALLADGLPAGAAAAGWDGVHLAAGLPVAPMRTTLGTKRLLGVACGVSRHAAMVAGEDGADYIHFGADDAAVDLEMLGDLARWWAELFVLPIALQVPATPDAVATAVEALADFVALGPELWATPDGLPERLAALRAIVEGRPPA